MTPAQIAAQWGLQPHFAYRVALVLYWCSLYRIPCTITSGARSSVKQKALYDRYLRGLSRFPAAPPGRSDHEKGLAVDLSFPTQYTNYVVYFARYAGLKWGGYFARPDPIHFYV